MNATGLDEVTVGMTKLVGERWFWRAHLAVWRERRIPDQWTVSILVPMYKMLRTVQRDESS